MKKNEIIDQLDINKLKIDRKKYNKQYNIIVVFMVLAFLIAVGCIANKNIILFILFIIVGIILKVISKKIYIKVEEIEYYINIIKRNEEQKEYDKYIIEKYAKDYTQEEIKTKYNIKSKTITNNEKYFLDIIKKHFKQDYEIRVQVPLASVIEKEKEFEGQYQNELNRIIDIGIFDKESSYPLLLIEINDPTHYRKDRQVRDAKLKNICDQAGIKLIAFWTDYSNTEEYILNRVNTNLRDSN